MSGVPLATFEMHLYPPFYMARALMLQIGRLYLPIGEMFILHQKALSGLNRCQICLLVLLREPALHSALLGLAYQHRSNIFVGSF